MNGSIRTLRASCSPTSEPTPRCRRRTAPEPVQGEAAKSRATALRSLFRALEWECVALGHSDLGRCGSGAWPDSPAVPVLGQRIRLSVGMNCALHSRACGLGE